MSSPRDIPAVLGGGLGRCLIRRYSTVRGRRLELSPRFVPPRPCRLSDLVSAASEAAGAGHQYMMVGDIEVGIGASK